MVLNIGNIHSRQSLSYLLLLSFRLCLSAIVLSICALPSQVCTHEFVQSFHHSSHVQFLLFP